ncbi:MAG: IS1182 family transposase [Aliifodinibius sp.]|nr:IS1182 family transposase [Candidatus Bathyarchaeota archaeon]NIT57550.1 IS1182 family transposase [Fodinibius sp.]NIY26132.1 IS1182 family transposase [Fodinibius sp.]
MAFIPVDRSQLRMLPPSVDDYIGKDDLCRFVIKVVSLLDLRELYAAYSSQGGDSYAPDMMLALWFYAYSLGIVRSRELEDRCIYDLRFRYIAGDLHPDHTTLSRFRKEHLDLMKSYFLQIVELAQHNDISKFKRIHIDGSRFQAKSSKRHNRTSDDLERQLNRVREQIDEYMHLCDESDAESQVMELPENNVEEVKEKLNHLRELEKQLEERQEQLEERKKSLKSEHRAKHQINLQEPEARNMRTSHGNILPAYNAQAAVDEDTNLIVANDLVDETNDFNQFSPIHQQTESILGKDETRQYNADAGYHSLEQLEYAHQNGVDLVMNDPAPQSRSLSKEPTSKEKLLEDNRALKRSDFGYDEQGDYYRCPAGQRLVFIEHLKATTRRGARKLYQAETSCRGCLFFKRCMPKNSKSDRRRIVRDIREKYAEDLARRLLSEDSQHRLKKRMTTNEPVFGNLKSNLKFQRFCLKGLLQSGGEYQLLCIAHNLSVLHRLITTKLRKPFMELSYVLLRLWQLSLTASKTFSKTITAIPKRSRLNFVRYLNFCQFPLQIPLVNPNLQQPL